MDAKELERSASMLTDAFNNLDDFDKFVEHLREENRNAGDYVSDGVALLRQGRDELIKHIFWCIRNFIDVRNV